MKFNRIILFVLCSMVLVPSLAHALELKSYNTTDDSKKVKLSFTFSAAVKDADFEVVSNYQGNFVALKFKGLKFTKKQLKADVPAKQDLELFYRYLRFTPGDSTGEVRVYLSKPVTPADVLTELREDKVTLEIVKPWWKLPGAKQPAEKGSEQPAFIPDGKTPDASTEEPAAQPDNTSELPPPGGGFRDVGQEEPAPPEPGAKEAPVAGAESTADAEDATPPASGTDETAAPPQAPSGTRATPSETYNQTEVGEIFGSGSGSARESKPAPPAAKPKPQDQALKEQPRQPRKGPGYTEFDLDQIPISGIEIRGLPFDEALLKLVGSSGFNVVVGKDVDSTEVNLNFTQKQITLKNALDLLCIAYDLTYTIEPDAIVIKGKS